MSKRSNASRISCFCSSVRPVERPLPLSRRAEPTAWRENGGERDGGQRLRARRDSHEQAFHGDRLSVGRETTGSSFSEDWDHPDTPGHDSRRRRDCGTRERRDDDALVRSSRRSSPRGTGVTHIRKYPTRITRFPRSEFLRETVLVRALPHPARPSPSPGKMSSTPWSSQVTDAPNAIARDPDRERASPSRNPKTSQQASRFKRGLQLEKLKAGEKSGPSSAARRGDDRGKPRATSLSRGGHQISYDRDKSARVYRPPDAPASGIPDANAPGKSNEFRCQNPYDLRAQSRPPRRVDGVQAPPDGPGATTWTCSSLGLTIVKVVC